MQRKVFVQLLTQLAKDNGLRLFRYYITLSLLDEQGSGKVLLDDATMGTLSTLFDVKPNTVHKNIQELAECGFYGHVSYTNHFYYSSQEIIAKRLGIELSSGAAITFTLANVAGTQVKFRATCNDAILAGMKQDQVTISRHKLHETTGRAKRTQRKYEKIAKVKVTTNVVHLDNNPKELQRHRENGRTHAYIHYDAKGKLGGGHIVVAQIPNSYTSQQFEKCRKRRALRIKGVGSAFQKVFFGDDVKAYKYWDKHNDRDVYYPLRKTKNLALWGRLAPYRQPIVA